MLNNMKIRNIMNEYFVVEAEVLNDSKITQIKVRITNNIASIISVKNKTRWTEYSSNSSNHTMPIKYRKWLREAQEFYNNNKEEE